jgi:hypothetical protein
MRALRMVLVMVVLSSLISGCQWFYQVLCDDSPKPDPQAAVFSGHVVSHTGMPLSEATVTVNGSRIITTDKGFFKLTVNSAPPYIVTIRKRGYGLFSRVYTKAVQKDNWALHRATLTTLNPAIGGIVQDTQAANCLAARPHSGWDHLEVKGSPVSPDLKMALDLAYEPAGCSPGVSIDIPPNALVDANGNNPPPLVEVEVSTVDVFSPEAMPGDWGVRFPVGYDRPQNNEQGFMQTLGAGSVSVMAGGKSYQLKSDKKARLTIPIDPTAVQMFKMLKQDLPETIPLLLYQEKEGIWKQMSMASLNEATTAYVADLPHFSEWNMDVVFSDVACTQIDSRLIDGGYYLKAVPSVIPAGGLQPHEFDVSNSSSCSTGDPFFCFIQAAWRLPSIAHGTGQISFMPGTRTGATITYNRANFVVPFGAKAPNQSQMPPTYVPSGTAGQPGSYPNCTTKVTFADKPTLTVATTLAALTFTASGYWGPNATIVPSNATDRYELQWCNTSTNSCATDPNYPQNPNAGGWTTFMALPNMSPTGPRPARSATSSPPILRNSLAAGTYQFRVRTHVGHSSFGVGGYDTPWSDATASITIVGNSPPTLASIGNQTVNVGTTVSLMASASDPDGGPLTYSITAFPAGATINSTTGAFSWTPLPAQGAMTHTVTVQVMDSGGLTNTKSFTITVRPQIKIENRMGGGPATGCATPIDPSMVRLQVQSSDKLVPLRTDTADGSIPQYGAAGSYIAAGSDSMTFDTTATTYTVVIEMGSWNAGGSGGFVQRRYTHNNATDGCTLGRYRYLDFTVTGQGPGLLTLRVQPSGNQYQVVVQGGTATLSTAAVGQKAITDFGRTTPYTP